MNVHVVTPSLPERIRFLDLLAEDLSKQTYRGFGWSVEFDFDREGPAVVRNRIVAASTAPWLAFVDDDDRVYPNHLETLTAAQEASGADVVYSFGKVTGRLAEVGFAHDCTLTKLDAHNNTIPVTALVRRSVFDAVGGFPTHMRNEDHGLWLAIRDHGGSFQCVHEVTWEYHFHGSNRSR